MIFAHFGDFMGWLLQLLDYCYYFWCGQSVIPTKLLGVGKSCPWSLSRSAILKCVGLARPAGQIQDALSALRSLPWAKAHLSLCTYIAGAELRKLCSPNGGGLPTGPWLRHNSCILAPPLPHTYWPPPHLLTPTHLPPGTTTPSFQCSRFFMLFVQHFIFLNFLRWFLVCLPIYGHFPPSTF